MADWQTISSEIVYETPWIKVRRDKVVNHIGTPMVYSIVEAQHPSVFIVALNNEGKILLEHTYRYTINQSSWELPAGHSDGQDPLTAAKRELLEETGYVSDDWISMGKAYQAVGVANLPMYVYVARDVHKAEVAPTEVGEQIMEYNFFSIEEIDTMIRNNQIISAGEITAYYIAKAKGIYDV